MPDRRRPHIRYQNPYGGHPILRRDAREAYQAVHEFLSKCTDWNGRWKDVSISVSPRDKFIPKEWDRDRVISKLIQKLGRGQAGITFNNITTGESSAAIEWPIAPRYHGWAIDFTLAQTRARRGYPDPVMLSASAEFKLRHPRTRRVLATQDPRLRDCWSIRSSVLLLLSAGNTSAFFDLCLPFPAADAEFIKFVSVIRPYLPIRLAKGGFRMLAPSKSAEGYTARRIDATRLAQL